MTDELPVCTLESAWVCFTPEWCAEHGCIIAPPYLRCQVSNDQPSPSKASDPGRPA